MKNPMELPSRIAFGIAREEFHRVLLSRIAFGIASLVLMAM